MNLNKSNYLIWLLIILTALALGLIYFSQDDSIQGQPTETNISQQVPEVSPKEAKINEIKNSLTLDQQIGQLILAKVPEVNQIEDIQVYNLGGYLIFSKEVEGLDTNSFTQKIQGWQNSAKLPMIIASDEEGGSVTRVSPILESGFASCGDLYQTGGLELIKSEEVRKAQILKSLGINVNLGPVADVSLNPNSFIYDRTLKLPPEETLNQATELTSQFVSTAVEAFKSVQEGSCLKHFPGYGENGDTHTDIIIDQQPLDILQTIDYPPFQAGIDAGAGSVLISHNIYTALDPNQPASLSVAVHSVLRNNLHFNGVIITDDFDMKAITAFTNQENAAITTINAGTDMIICSNYQSIIPSIKTALENGTISQNRFNEALNHVLGWKYDLGLFI